MPSAPKLASGSRAQVMHGTAKHTAGGLEKRDLMYSKSGKIVGKDAHAAGVKAMRRLKASGLAAKPFKKSPRRSARLAAKSGRR